MSAADSDDEGTPAGDNAPAELARPERPRLRTRPLGYKRADVDEALGARDAELEELKQDIAALWLAFAQHDRMIRALGGESPQRPAATPTPQEHRSEEDSQAIAADAEAIGHQLSELDEVLAAIELATQTLERTYSEEIEAPGPASDADERSATPESSEPEGAESGPDEPEAEPETESGRPSSAGSA